MFYKQPSSIVKFKKIKCFQHPWVEIELELGLTKIKLSQEGLILMERRPNLMQVWSDSFSETWKSNPASLHNLLIAYKMISKMIILELTATFTFMLNKGRPAGREFSRWTIKDMVCCPRTKQIIQFKSAMQRMLFENGHKPSRGMWNIWDKMPGHYVDTIWYTNAGEFRKEGLMGAELSDTKYTRKAVT